MTQHRLTFLSKIVHSRVIFSALSALILVAGIVGLVACGRVSGPDPVEIKVEISGNKIAPAHSSVRLTAKVLFIEDGSEISSQTVGWEISSVTSPSGETQTAEDTKRKVTGRPVNGVYTLNIAELPIGTVITVKATAEADRTVSNTHAITIMQAAVQVESIKIYSVDENGIKQGEVGSQDIVRGTSATFEAEVITNPASSDPMTKGFSVSLEDEAGDTAVQTNNRVEVTVSDSWEGVDFPRSFTLKITSNYSMKKTNEITIIVPEPVISNITISSIIPAAQGGGKVQFTAQVDGQHNPPQDVSWHLKGNDDSNTSIDANGVLTLGANETVGGTIKVWATSKFDTEKDSNEIEITVLEPANVVLKNFTIVGDTIVAQSVSSLFTTTHEFETSSPQPSPLTYVWSIVGDSHQAGTTITSNNGVLKIAKNETLQSITIKVIASYGGIQCVNGEATLTVKIPYVDAITITPATTLGVNRGDKNSHEFVATAAGKQNWNTDADESVTWTFDVVNSVAKSNNTLWTIDKNKLTLSAIGDDQAPGNLVFKATSVITPSTSETLTISVRSSTVASVTADPSMHTIERGSSKSLAGIITVTGEGFPGQSVTWSILEKVGGGTFGANTKFDGETLSIDENETPGTFTVRATSEEDPAKYVDVTIVVPEPTVTGVTIATRPPAFVRGGTYTASEFTATVTGSGNPDKGVVWTVEDGGVAKHQGTVFDVQGTLTVHNDQLPGTLTLKATSVFNPSKSNTATITVARPIVASVTITGEGVNNTGEGADNFTVRVLREKTLQLSATVNGSPEFGHPEQSITWTLSDPKGGTITADGSLTVGRDFNGNAFTVTARATGSINAAPNAANLTVNIPPTATKVEIIDFPKNGVNRGEFSETMRAMVDGLGTGIGIEHTVTWTLHRLDGTEYPNAETQYGTDLKYGVLTAGGREKENIVVVRATAVGPDVRPTAFKEERISIIGPEVVGDWRMVKVGIDHVMAITWEGRKLYTWGRNSYGQLGHGDRAGKHGQDDRATQRMQPKEVITPGATNEWRSVAGGWAHTVALHMNNTIWMTGRLAVGGTGGNDKVIIKDYGNSLTKVTVSGLSDDGWKAVYASHSAVFAIRTDGTIYAWGDDAGRLLGTEVAGNKNEPTKVNIPLRKDGTTEEFKLLSASKEHVLALTTDGRLFGWGSNSKGQLANVNGSAPQEIKISSLLNIRWETVSASNEWSAGIIAGEFDEGDGRLSTARAGELYTWGNNQDGRLGQGSEGGNKPPARIGGSNTFRSINMNATTFGVAIDTSGKLWSWGKEQYGQLGRGDALSNDDMWNPREIEYGSSDPKQDFADVPFSSKIWTTSITGGSFALAIDSEGDLWAWGHNQYGMLGNGEEGGTGSAVNRASANRNRPIKVKDLKDIGTVN